MYRLDGKTIPVGFRYFSKTFNPNDNYLLRYLRPHYRIHVCDAPEIMFFSVHDGSPRWTMPAVDGPFVRVFLTAENCRPDMNRCDWALSFDFDETVQDPRHLRLPLYVFAGDAQNLIKSPQYAQRITSAPRRFCNYFYSKDAPERVAFFKELSRYRPVDAPGKSLNNMPPIDGPPLVRLFSRLEHAITGRSRVSALLARHLRSGDAAKVAFLRNYKFTIAFENSSHPGYVTEKIVHPMLAGSIPIYWGSPEIARDFNPGSFVNVHDFRTQGEALERIREIDRDPVLYSRILDEPWYHGNRPNQYTHTERILGFFDRIFSSSPA